MLRQCVCENPSARWADLIVEAGKGGARGVSRLLFGTRGRMAMPFSEMQQRGKNTKGRVGVPNLFNSDTLIWKYLKAL